MAAEQTRKLCKGEEGPSYMKNVGFFKGLRFLGMLRSYLRTLLYLSSLKRKSQTPPKEKRS